MIKEMSLLELFKEKKALLEGHFVLSSGLHSNKYFQSALLLQDPKLAAELGEKLAALFNDEIDVVVAPALGGLIIGHEVARAKGTPFIFSEKDKEGKPAIRRGFELQKGQKVLIIEDVITTGLSSGEVIKLVEGFGANVVGIGAIVNRSGKEDANLFDQTKNVHSLLKLDVQTWIESDLPESIKKIPAVKPGSRKRHPGEGRDPGPSK